MPRTKTTKTPKVATSSALNTRVDPPVMIVRNLVLSFAEFSNNDYEINDEAVPASDLDAVQRGHIYQVEWQDERVVVRCSLRICDKETGKLVRGLRSLQNEAETLLKRYPRNQSMIHQPKALNFEFSLSTEDYQVFRERAKDLGAVVEDGVMDPEELNRMRSAVIATLDLVDSEIIRARKILHGDDPTRADPALLIHEENSMRLEGCWKNVGLIQSASKNLERVPDKTASVSATAKSANIALRRFRKRIRDAEQAQEDLMALVRKVSYDPTSKPVGSIEEEMGRLSKYYPILGKVKYGTKEDGEAFLRVSVLGAEIELTNGSVFVEGSVDGLLRAMKEPMTVARPLETEDDVEGRFLAWDED